MRQCISGGVRGCLRRRDLLATDSLMRTQMSPRGPAMAHALGFQPCLHRFGIRPDQRSAGCSALFHGQNTSVTASPVPAYGICLPPSYAPTNAWACFSTWHARSSRPPRTSTPAEGCLRQGGRIDSAAFASCCQLPSLNQPCAVSIRKHHPRRKQQHPGTGWACCSAHLMRHRLRYRPCGAADGDCSTLMLLPLLQPPLRGQPADPCRRASEAAPPAAP